MKFFAVSSSLLRAKEGYRADNPIDNVSIGGFYAALKTLHFNRVAQQATLATQAQDAEIEFLDQILFKHAMLNQGLCLFNKSAPFHWDLRNGSAVKLWEWQEITPTIVQR